MRNRLFSKNQRRPVNDFTLRDFQGEQLEPRILLAGDTVASWQNAANCNDVDQNGVVNSLDALQLIRAINNDGVRPLTDRASGEPGDGSPAALLVDTNGDGWLSAADALQVIELLNGQGEGEIVSYSLRVTNLEGTEVSELNVGEAFLLSALVTDLRDGSEAQGVFAGYVDVTYDSALVSLDTSQDIVFGADYPNGRSGNILTPGLLDEVGGFAGGTVLGAETRLLFTVTMMADGPGTVTFASDSADVLPARETLLFGTNDEVLPSDIDFGSVMLTITAAQEDTVVDDQFTLSEDSTDNRLDVLANDSLGSDLPIAEVIQDDAARGMATISADGRAILYTPDPDYFGPASFGYTVNSPTAGVLRADVELTITNVLDPPVARDDNFPDDLPPDSEARAFFVEDAGQAIVLTTVLSNDGNVDGDQQEMTFISGTTDPQFGTVSFTDQQITYLAAPNFFGQDSFTYTTTGAVTGLSATATITVTISEVNDAPITADETLTATAGQTTVFSAAQLLANDAPGPANESSQTLRLADLNYAGTGTATINGDGDIEYTPADGFSGSETIFYIVQDNGTTNGVAAFLASIATLTVNVEASQNNPPSAFNDDVVIEADGGAQALRVLVNDTTLPDLNETLTVDMIVVQPQNGTATITAAGDDILYTPNAGFTGTDSLQYRISDGRGGTATAEVEISVEFRNIPPIAVDDQFTVVAPGVQSYNVLLNDSGEAGEVLRIIAVDTSGTAGNVEINADGSRILYTPNFSSPGTDSFTYTIDDGTGQTATATVTVSVSDLTGESFFAGSVYNDLDNDGRRDSNERGLGSVSVVLSGVDANGNDVNVQTRTSISGEFRFDAIAPGEYTVSERQPVFVSDGENMLGPVRTTSDDFDFEVTDQLITSGGNTFGERGLAPQFSVLDALSSSRQPGALLVLEDSDLAWVEDRGGWQGIGVLSATTAGDTLSLSSTTAGSGSLSMSNRSLIALIGRSAGNTLLRINGTSQQILTASAVEQAFAS